MNQPSSLAADLRGAWHAQAQSHPLITLGLAASAAGVVLLLVAGIVNALTGENRVHVGYAVLGGTAGFAATALGALMALGLRAISARTQDAMLGFAAGMMLAASAFSLILPGLDAAGTIVGPGPAAAAVVALGLGWACC